MGVPLEVLGWSTDGGLPLLAAGREDAQQGPPGDRAEGGDDQDRACHGREQPRYVGPGLTSDVQRTVTVGVVCHDRTLTTGVTAERRDD